MEFKMKGGLPKNVNKQFRNFYNDNKSIFFILFVIFYVISILLESLGKLKRIFWMHLKRYHYTKSVIHFKTKYHIWYSFAHTCRYRYSSQSCCHFNTITIECPKNFFSIVKYSFMFSYWNSHHVLLHLKREK